LTILLPALETAAAADHADVVFRNGKIYTADGDRSIREGVAVAGNTIVAVGTDADMAPLIGPATRVVDLGGKLMLPGFIDTHIHPILGAVNGAKCDLTKVKTTVEALREKIQACLAERPGGPDEWLEAVQLYNYGFEATLAELDAIESERPIALVGNDGHSLWVNSRGLELAGITDETPDPVGGKIARDPSGAATGAFSDNAAMVVLAKIPPMPVEEQVELTKAALDGMSAFGITTMLDAYVTPTETRVWRAVHADGYRNMRVRAAVFIEDASDDSDAAVAALVAASRAHDVGDPDFLRGGFVKVFADGVIQAPSQTGALLEPYLDADGKPTANFGELYFDPDRFANLVTSSMRPA